MKRSTDCGDVPSIYSITPTLKAQGTSWKRGQRDCKSQRTSAAKKETPSEVVGRKGRSEMSYEGE